MEKEEVNESRDTKERKRKKRICQKKKKDREKSMDSIENMREGTNGEIKMWG